MPRLETKYGSKAESREPVGIPENQQCLKCGPVPKSLCFEKTYPVNQETLENLKKSGIDNLTLQFNLCCPKCSSQIYSILIEE